jgi:hypothetical protein
MLSELGKALRAGDLWVAGSRRYKDFEEYLLPEEAYWAIKSSGLPLAVEPDCGIYLQQRSQVSRCTKLGDWRAVVLRGSLSF